MDYVGVEIFAVVGFLLASYSIVANDAIQTLGTFLASNAKRPWWVLWLFASSIIIAVMVMGWIQNGGDIAFGRLNRIPYPEFQEGVARPDWWARWDPPGGIEWYHAVPPLVLLFLTRFGIPVSTTFLVLTIFALTGGAQTEGIMESMLIKSLLGYLVAFGAGAVVYLIVSRAFERWVANTRGENHATWWFVLQWLSTGYLWWQWLVQDLANIFVFLPRSTTETTLPDGSVQTVVAFDPLFILFATGVMLMLHALIFATRGGEIQKIVLTKTNTTDIRAATLVDFIYGTILLVFKEANDIPMSTTWVFLGLLAGRELMITALVRIRTNKAAVFDVVSDVMRALIGLFISVFLAIVIPRLAGAPAALDIGLSAIAGLAAATFAAWGIMWTMRGAARAANIASS